MKVFLSHLPRVTDITVREIDLTRRHYYHDAHTIFDLGYKTNNELEMDIYQLHISSEGRDFHTDSH